MMSSREMLDQLISNGFEIKGEVAVREQYRVQAIKEAIVEEDLRPNIPPGIPPFFKAAITKCWVKYSHLRPNLSQLASAFEEQLTIMNEVWTEPKSEEPGEEESDQEEENRYLRRFNSPQAFSEQVKFPEYPIRATFKNITLNNITLKGKVVQIRIKFRGKLFFSGKLKVPSKNKIPKLEFKEKVLSKLALDTMCTSLLKIQVIVGSYKMSKLCSTEIFLGFFAFKLTPIPFILTNKDGTANGELSLQLDIKELSKS